MIESFLLPSPAADFGPAAVSDEDLSLLYSVRRLPWLQEILDAQLRHWDVHDVGRYYQFSPQPVTRWDIWRCTKAAPYWALARWMGRLTLSQRGFCMRRSPQGAVSFALERLPPWSRTSLIEKHPAAALLNAADKLTDAEFAFCATREPQAVFAVSCRRRLQPDRRAVLWSVLYPKLHYRFGYEQPPGLQRDMLDSITAFPTIWLDAHQGGGFAAIFSGLERHFAIRLDIAAISAMHHRMDPSGRQAFAHHIASLI